MNPDFPVNIETLDRDWLTRVLRRGLLQANESVRSVSCESLASGYTSSVYRLWLKYDPVTTTAPHSLVIKLHSSSNSIRQRFQKLGIYEKEVRFYQFVGTSSGLPLPTCYAAEYAQDRGDFVLLFEDLSAARVVDRDDGAIADIRIALAQLARIHGRFWGDPRLQQYDWVAYPAEVGEASPLKAEWVDNLCRVKRDFHDFWPARAWSVCDRIAENWDDIMRCINRDTHTLVHTDAHLGQMFFPSPELPRFVLFDWQYPCKALAAEDVTHLIVNELSVDERRQQETALVDLYYQSLCAEGVTDLGPERFWFQCKLSLIWLILMHFRTLAIADLFAALKQEAEDSGEAWQDWVFGQLGAAIDDWQMSEVLDQAIAEGRQVNRSR